MHKFSITFLLTCLLAFSVYADDPGITKARLIQLSDTSYLLEADVSQQFIWAIRPPIFPDRFEVSDIEYQDKSGWTVVKVSATTSGAPLSIEDELLLPWMRNGADITVQWLDGTFNKALFIRSIEGIRIPMAQLIEIEKSDTDILKEYFVAGGRHAILHGIHLLFVLALVLLVPNFKALKLLLWYSLGQGLSLIMVDINIPGFDLVFVDLIGLIVVLLLATAIVNSTNKIYFIPLLIAFGILHGLAFNQEIVGSDVGLDQQLKALFAFCLSIEMVQFVAAFFFIMLAKIKLPTRKLAYLPGVLSVFLILLLFQNYVIKGDTDILETSTKVNATQFALPASQGPQSGGTIQQGARALRTPIMNYISIEPYEVRLEILFKARTAVQILGANERGKGSIPIESLVSVKEGLLKAITNYNELTIDGEVTQPVMSRADFVTLGAAGVLLREVPKVESLDNGIIGITLIYETSGLPNGIKLRWNVFPPEFIEIETTIIDPFGGSVEVLKPQTNEINWKKKLSGYMVPALEQVAYKKPELSLISILLFVLIIISLRIPKIRMSRSVLAVGVMISFLLYPFIRTEISLPFVSHWVPSSAQTTEILDKLLTNVYRSFDVRNEEEVYDRLATSVEGDQLTEIYLQNRQSMELEYRGGARAKVEELNVQEIKDISKGERGDIIAEVSWLVGGSVSHFGHTHYRRNYNHALVTFAIVGNHWKIKNIELLDERRII